MVRIRVFGSGRVLLTNEAGKILEDFIVPDPEKAQEIVMEKLKETNRRKNEQPGRS